MQHVALIVDGNALMHRAFHALPPFKTSRGVPTQITYGFFSVLQGTLSDFKPTHLLVCFDTPAPTFRNALLAQYQMQRPPIADEFKVQIPTVKQALVEAGVVHKELDGFEADDIIGTATELYAKAGYKVLILTGDKDIMQLVSDSVSVVTPQLGFGKTKIYGPREVQEKLGVPASLIPDWKALAGDPSDNYKGAEGIGPKTAVKLLDQFGTVETLIAQIDRLPEGRIKKSIEQHIAEIKVSKQLALIRSDVPLDIAISQTAWGGYATGLRTFLEELEMHSLVSRLFPAQRKISHKEQVQKKEAQEPQMSLF